MNVYKMLLLADTRPGTSRDEVLGYTLRGLRAPVLRSGHTGLSKTAVKISVTFQAATDEQAREAARQAALETPNTRGQVTLARREGRKFTTFFTFRTAR